MDLYQPRYDVSRALIIGIDDYEHAAPFKYAVADAQVVAETLTCALDFPSGDIVLLKDREATKERITGAYLNYTSEEKCGPDDRIVFFFAGHGHTRLGRRGEVGFLVPSDGDIENIASLIRWDDLTQNAELVRAKHVLFIMDACYGGLALARALPAGSVRFLKDMLQRCARQVITAGKANQTVADSGGPIAGHSVFTGHLIEALTGKAETPDGVLAASGVMS